MAEPTIFDAKNFINQNESFFKTPLSFHGAKEFENFYKDRKALNEISDYSSKLLTLLTKYEEKLTENDSETSISAWFRGDFDPMLKHEEVRQFIINNKYHKALLMWADKVFIEEKTVEAEKQTFATTAGRNLIEILAEKEKSAAKKGLSLIDSLTEEKKKIADDYLNTVQEYFEQELMQLKEKLEKNGATPEEIEALYDRLNTAQTELFLSIKSCLDKKKFNSAVNTFIHTCDAYVNKADKIMGHGWLYKTIEVILKALTFPLAVLGMSIASVWGRGFKKTEHYKTFKGVFFTFEITPANKVISDFKEKINNLKEKIEQVDSEIAKNIY